MMIMIMMMMMMMMMMIIIISYTNTIMEGPILNHHCISPKTYGE
jgi:hypothetical protein